MAEWDPLADAPEPSGLDGVTPSDVDEFVAVDGIEGKVSRRDLERLHVDVSRRFNKECPWQTLPEPQPDLTWHTPTCTFEDWKHKDVKVDLGSGIMYVTLSKPDDNNALTDGVISALCDVLFLLHARHDIRVAVFTGEGKMLCAGRDPRGDPFGFNIQAKSKTLEEDAQAALQGGAFPDDKVNIGRLMQAKFWHAWATLPQFTICLANGSALGDGMGCVCCCDMAIALKTSFFGFSDTKLGLVHAGISPYLLAKTSPGTAKNMFVLGQVLSAEVALEKRIVNRLVDSVAQGREAIREMCQEVTKCGPRSVQLAKELVLGVAGRQITEAIIFYTLIIVEKAKASEEARQGAQAASAKKAKPWEASPIVPPH